MEFCELDSFVKKFVSLWRSGCEANLQVQSRTGNAYVNLQLGLGQADAMYMYTPLLLVMVVAEVAVQPDSEEGHTEKQKGNLDLMLNKQTEYLSKIEMISKPCRLKKSMTL